jgi:hypothetical protein
VIAAPASRSATWSSLPRIVDGAAPSQGVTVELIALGPAETTPVVFRITASR